MWKRRAAWWTLGQVAGVEPTHKGAARASRPGVVGRTGSAGTQREAGSRVGESLRTGGCTVKCVTGYLQ